MLILANQCATSSSARSYPRQIVATQRRSSEPPRLGEILKIASPFTAQLSRKRLERRLGRGRAITAQFQNRVGAATQGSRVIRDNRGQALFTRTPNGIERTQA